MARRELTSDGKTELLRILVRNLRKQGLSFTSAMGIALANIEPGFDWQGSFPPSANDKRILGATR